MSIQDISGVSSINTIVYWVTVHLRFSIKAVFMFLGLDFSFVMHLLCVPLLSERFFFFFLSDCFLVSGQKSDGFPVIQQKWGNI